MSTMSGQAIFENFTQGNLGGLQSCDKSTQFISGSYQSRSEALKKLISDMQSAWKGAASGAAQRGMTPLTAEHEFAAERLKTVQDAIKRQIEAFEKARNSVVSVPRMPAEPGYWENYEPNGTSNAGYERLLRAFNTANDHNIEVMKAYEAATQENQRLLSAALRNLNTAEPPPGGQPPQPGGPGRPGPGPAPRQAPPDGGQAPGFGGTSSQFSGNGGTNTSNAWTGFGQTDPQYTPSRPQTPLPVENGWSRPGGPGPVPGGSGGAPGQLGTGLVPLGGGPGSAAEAGRGGAGGNRGFGPGGSGGTEDPNGERGRRSGGRGGDAGGRAAGGGADGRRAAGEGSTGRGARGGAGGGSAGHGGHGQGEDDLEHYRPSYLVEADPEQVFGTNEVTAPAVIGE
jgi:uncharacterized protein YukE